MRRDAITAALHVYLALVLLYMAAPIVFVFVYAFSSVSYAVFPPPGFSTRWFVKLFEQADLLRAALNSLVIAVVATLASLVAGTLAALALVRYRFPGREVLRAAFLAPLIVPRIAFGVGMLIYAVVLRRFGGLDSLIAAHLMLTLPFAISILAASLVAAERVLEEAAMDLGATPVQAFVRVTIPQIRTGLLVSGFFAFIISWDQVPAVLVTFLDVTQRSRAEEAERQAEALRSVTQLASATAHEINNPLAVIMGNCELLAREVEPPSQRRVQAMLAAVDRIRKIVVHMSHITRLELAYHSPNLPQMLDLQKSSGAAGSGEPGGAPAPRPTTDSRPGS